MTKDANQSAAETAKHPDHFLAEWREYRGLSQRGLADMVSVSHSKINRIETGFTELKQSFAKRLARFFNIPPIALLTINPLGEGRQTAEMLDAWAAIDPKKREDVLRMMRAFGSNGSDQKTG